MVNYPIRIVVKTIGDLKDILNQYDDDLPVAIQMIDGEYDRIGLITEYSDVNSKDWERDYLDDETTLLLRCDDEYIHSKY